MFATINGDHTFCMMKVFKCQLCGYRVDLDLTGVCTTAKRFSSEADWTVTCMFHQLHIFSLYLTFAYGNKLASTLNEILYILDNNIQICMWLMAVCVYNSTGISPEECEK